MDEVACSGNEFALIDCPSNPIGNHDCNHIEDAGVKCDAPSSGSGDVILLYRQLEVPLKYNFSIH